MDAWGALEIEYTIKCVCACMFVRQAREDTIVMRQNDMLLILKVILKFTYFMFLNSIQGMGFHGLEFGCFVNGIYVF